MLAAGLSHAQWTKSSYSGGGNDCVEVARNLPGVVAVRDSKNPGGPALVFPHSTWRVFVEQVRADVP
jgi:hypothetical protein